MADNPFAGDITSNAKITSNVFAADINGSTQIDGRGVQVELAANPVTQGPTPSVADTSLKSRSEIRGIPPQLDSDGPVPSVVDTSGGSATTAPKGTYPGSMRPPSSVDTRNNR